MKHTAHDDSVIEKYLASLDSVDAIAWLVPKYQSAPLDDKEYRRWCDRAVELLDDLKNNAAVAEVVAIYSCVPGGILVGDEKFMAPKSINFSAASKPGECAAKRCPETDITDVVVDGRTLKLCARHIEACKASGQIAPGASVVVREPETIVVAGYEAELAAATQEATSDLVQAKGFRIETQDDVNSVATVLQAVHGRINELEARRTEITKPMNTALRSVNDLFRPPMDALREISSLLKAEVKRFEAESAERNKKAMEEAARLVAAGKDPAPALSGVALVANADGLTMRKTWKWRITDEALIPRAFLCVDEAKLKALVTIRPDIAGIEWFEDSGVAVSAR